MNTSLLKQDDIKNSLERVDSYDMEYFDSMIDMAIEQQEKESTLTTVKKISVACGVIAVTGLIASPLIPVLGYKSGFIIYAAGSLASVCASYFM